MFRFKTDTNFTGCDNNEIQVLKFQYGQNNDNNTVNYNNDHGSKILAFLSYKFF